MRKALIFDCDGVLGDTEQFGHRVAFNQMWQELGVPWQWTVEEYGRKLKIGGGKERMASLFAEPDFLKAWPEAPTGPDARDTTIAAWHKRKTEIYKEIIESGRIPPRSGVKRLAEEALASGWLLAVASTSAPEAVNAVLRHVVGDAIADCFSLLLAGDIVKAKKPAPDIYLMAARELGVSPDACVVVEDSNNGVESAHQAGMKCVVTVSGYTRDEDFSHASIVLTSLGDPGDERCVVLENRSAARPVDCFRVSDLDHIRSGENSSMPAVELIVRTVAETAIANENYFSQLDSVAGDGDFGYSLARGFEKVLEGFESFDRSSPGAFLKKIGLVIASRAGGTSGPLWGTAFMRAASAAGSKTVLSGADAVAMLRAAVEGIQARGGASVGDKTLLDALVPAIDSLETGLRSPAPDGAAPAIANAAQVAERAAAETSGMIAKRGRASYTGERSIGSPDPGAVAIGVIAGRVSDAWRDYYSNSSKGSSSSS